MSLVEAFVAVGALVWADVGIGWVGWTDWIERVLNGLVWTEPC